MPKAFHEQCQQMVCHTCTLKCRVDTLQGMVQKAWNFEASSRADLHISPYETSNFSCCQSNSGGIIKVLCCKTSLIYLLCATKCFTFNLSIWISSNKFSSYEKKVVLLMGLLGIVTGPVIILIPEVKL